MEKTAYDLLRAAFTQAPSVRNISLSHEWKDAAIEYFSISIEHGGVHLIPVVKYVAWTKACNPTQQDHRNANGTLHGSLAYCQSMLEMILEQVEGRNQ